MVMGILVQVVGPSVDCYGLNFVVMACVDLELLIRQVEFGIQPKDKSWIDAVPPVTLNLWCQVVQCVEMIDQEIEVTLRDVFPFILIEGVSSGLRHVDSILAMIIISV